MLKEIIINQVKGLLKKAIERFANKQLGISPQVVGIVVKALNNDGDPQLYLSSNYSKVKELYVSDLYSNIDIITYKTMGFDVNKGTVEWLKKFILKASSEFGYDVKVPEFYIGLNGKELFAIMYVNGKQIDFSDNRSDIPLEYILTTK